MSQTEYIENTAEKIKDKIVDCAIFFNSLLGFIKR